MPHTFALVVETVTTALTVAGIGYFLAVLLAARIFVHQRRAQRPEFTPPVSILKSLKGLDPGMLDAFRSHCRQDYRGEFELLFGVSSLDDPAAAAVETLKTEFPEREIRLILCPERLGTNGKVSTLVQLALLARHDFLLINDSDITVTPHYLERVMACFAPETDSSGAKASFRSVGSDVRAEARTLQRVPVGLVTALYRGRAHGSLPSRLEALGIAAEFMGSVLLSKWIERGMHYGLGSTLAVRREALERTGGLLPLVDYLADDYELGARVARAGYRVELAVDVVETSVPAYTWRGFVEHQLRWARAVRCSRPAGYAGLVVTHGLSWALLNIVAGGLSPLSLWLLALGFFLRLTQAMTVGAEVLGDRDVISNLWLLPLRDVLAMAIWVAGFAGNTIIWRGERFRLTAGKPVKLDPA